MADNVTKLIMETILGLITTAFAFVAGSAWNDAISGFISTINLPSGPFVYAIVVTIIAVIVTVLLARFAGKMGIELGE